MRPILDKIGSDPEFMPGVRSEFEFYPTPANKVISNNKQLTLNSFIGTDGHNSIGELRPRPAHNIRQHLYDIATAIVAMDEHLKKRKDLKNIEIYAYPELGDDTLAGHIHVSFFVDDPLTKAALEYGIIQGVGGNLVSGFTCGLNVGPPNSITNSDSVSLIARYVEEAEAGRLLTPRVFAQGMSFFLDPLEWWLQPWHSRIRRNRHYGTGNDIVRWQQDGLNPLTRPKLADYAWMHFEYRTPSTWLVHPSLAYTYLALAKTTMVNWQLIQELQVKLPDSVRSMTPEPQNASAATVFLERWNYFKSHKGRITRDALYLDRAIQTCANSRDDWFSTHGKVRVEAWRGLL